MVGRRAAMGEGELTAAAAGRFVRADGRRREEPSPNLYVANCGPAVGLSMADIAAAFSPFGEVHHVRLADDTGTRVIVSFADSDSAEAALLALHARPCPALRDRLLHIRFSFLLPSLVGVPKNNLAFVCSNASELGIPGVYLLLDFVSLEEEQVPLLSISDCKSNRLIINCCLNVFQFSIKLRTVVLLKIRVLIKMGAGYF